MPGSVMAWPASATMRRSACGQARVQVPGVLDRRHHVVAAVHDDAGDVGGCASTSREQLVVALEEAAVDEVVALDAREGERVGVGAERRDALGVLAAATASLPSHTLQARAAASCTSRSGWVRRRW